jgi:hypothetical protein
MVTEKSVGASKSKKKRPDGTDVSRYANINNWSYRRWAWEFLRRNTNFITACKRAQDGSEADKQNVANEFGLKQFKDYRESYIGSSGSPKFSIGSISSWSHLDAKKKSARKQAVRIEFGQIVIRFDLEQAIQDRKAVDKQLRLAKLKLENSLDEYESQTDRKSTLKEFKPSVFGKCLRALDGMAAGMSQPKIAAQIFPSVANADRDKKIEKIKPIIRRAREISTNEYLHLSVLKGKPEGKSIAISG